MIPSQVSSKSLMIYAVGPEGDYCFAPTFADIHKSNAFVHGLLAKEGTFEDQRHMALLTVTEFLSEAENQTNPSSYYVRAAFIALWVLWNDTSPGLVKARTEARWMAFTLDRIRKLSFAFGDTDEDFADTKKRMLNGERMEPTEQINSAPSVRH